MFAYKLIFSIYLKTHMKLSTLFAKINFHLRCIISKNSPIENRNFCYWLDLCNIAHVVTIRKMTKSALVA